MELNKISYADLNAKQKEIYNFQKLAGILAEYGFNCIKLADDWQGADFLAYHKDGQETLRVQLKSRVSINKKYLGKNLHIAFPHKGRWYLIEHDALVDKVREHTNWLSTDSWCVGAYTSASVSAALASSLEGHLLLSGADAPAGE